MRVTHGNVAENNTCSVSDAFHERLINVPSDHNTFLYERLILTYTLDSGVVEG
jgi:hypothetical protein